MPVATFNDRTSDNSVRRNRGHSMHDRTFTPTRSRVWTVARFAAHSMPPRMLLVDDYIDSADALAAFLANSGFDTRVAYNGYDALKIANEWHPDSVVLDIAMPGVSGLGGGHTPG